MTDLSLSYPALKGRNHTAWGRVSAANTQLHQEVYKTKFKLYCESGFVHRHHFYGVATYYQIKNMSNKQYFGKMIDSR